MDLVREWAGKSRPFSLSFGTALDLQEASGAGIGVIYRRMLRGEWYAGDVYHTIRLALVGGGMDLPSANALMKAHFDGRPWLTNAALALEILGAVMSGVEEGAHRGGEGDDEPLKFSTISQVCRVFHLSPIDLRAMRYADVANMMAGFNVKDGKKLAPMSEDEFAEMLAQHHDPRLDEEPGVVEG